MLVLVFIKIAGSFYRFWIFVSLHLVDVEDSQSLQKNEKQMRNFKEISRNVKVQNSSVTKVTKVIQIIYIFKCVDMFWPD